MYFVIFHSVCETATHRRKEVVTKEIILMSGRREGNRHMEGGQGKKQYTVTSAPSIAKVCRELH